MIFNHRTRMMLNQDDDQNDAHQIIIWPVSIFQYPYQNGFCWPSCRELFNPLPLISFSAFSLCFYKNRCLHRDVEQGFARRSPITSGNKHLNKPFSFFQQHLFHEFGFPGSKQPNLGSGYNNNIEVLNVSSKF